MSIEVIGDNPPVVFADGFFGDPRSGLARQELELPEVNEE